MFEFQGKAIIENEDGEYIELVDKKRRTDIARQKMEQKVLFSNADHFVTKNTISKFDSLFENSSIVNKSRLEQKENWV